MTPADPATPSDSDDTRATPRGVRSSLLALGSAAVLAVYTAGFVRTRAAAERFEFAETRGRLPASDSIVLVQETIPAAAPVVHPLSVAKTKPVHHETATKDTEPAPPVAVAAVPTAPAVASAVPAVPVPTPTNTAKPDTTVAATDSLRPRFKEGRYRGWGYSQHGNIEAEVEIQGGRIVNVSITTCLMAWGCGAYIRHLPPQVLERQSPDVDTVSGATQTANSFYWAVANALGKAT